MIYLEKKAVITTDFFMFLFSPPTPNQTICIQGEIAASQNDLISTWVSHLDYKIQVSIQPLIFSFDYTDSTFK